MTITINEIRRVFRYNGVALPDVPGMTPREIRDLYSAQYPELISAGIETGEVVDGVQEYTFRKAVGTKGGMDGAGGRLAALKAAIDAESTGQTGAASQLARALTKRHAKAQAHVWGAFALRSLHGADARHMARALPASDMLAPLP
jgi:PRTRC genetic system protein C